MAAYILDSIEKIRNQKIVTMLKICQGSRKYPLDCVTDGGLQLLINYILELEKAGGQEMGPGDPRK